MRFLQGIVTASLQQITQATQVPFRLQLLINLMSALRYVFVESMWYIVILTGFHPQYAPPPSQTSMETSSIHSTHAYRHFSLPPPPIPHTPAPTDSARVHRVSTGANAKGEGWKLAGGRSKTMSFHDNKARCQSFGATVVEPKAPDNYFHTSAPRESSSFVGGFVIPPQPLPHTAPNSAPAMYHYQQQPPYNEVPRVAPPVRHYSAPEYTGKS